MARPKNSVPTYRLHSPSGTARCWVGGKWINLGKYNSPESRTEYARILAEVAVAPVPAATPVAAHTDVTVNELLLGFWRYAEGHYGRADGTPTNELPQFRQTFRLVRELYGHTPAREFGPLALKALRQKMIDAGWRRKLINQRVGRVRGVFRWAVENELVPVTVLQALAAVQGLQAGRSPAKETEPVMPVEEAHVRATLPFLRPAVRAMVQVQLLTGMRPGEVCQLRPCDLDTSGGVWLFRPRPAQDPAPGSPAGGGGRPERPAALDRVRPGDPDRRLLQPSACGRAVPRRAGGEPEDSAVRLAHLSDAEERALLPKRLPAERYTVTAYDRAISRAVVKATPAGAADRRG